MTDRSPDLVAGVPRSRIVIASMVGTTVEFYDFYIYATAAVSVFPFLFFPKGNPTTALLASLATFRPGIRRPPDWLGVVRPLR